MGMPSADTTNACATPATRLTKSSTNHPKRLGFGCGTVTSSALLHPGAPASIRQPPARGFGASGALREFLAGSLPAGHESTPRYAPARLQAQALPQHLAPARPRAVARPTPWRE